MPDQRGAIFSRADHGLHLRFRHVHLHADAVRLGEIAAAGDERVAAMMRDGRPERRAKLVAAPRPVLDQLAAGGEADVIRRGTQGLGLFAQACGHRVDHAGDGPEERRVSHHRRDDRSHSDVGIGPRHRVDAFDRRRGNFGGEVVAGGAALLQHLQRADPGGQIFGLGRASARGPRIGVEQKFQRPAVSHRLAERDRGVGVGIDQPRDQQAIGCVDPFGIAADTLAGRQHGRDRVAIDQQIGMAAIEPTRRQHAAAMNELLHAGVSTRSTAACSIRRNEATPASMRKP